MKLLDFAASDWRRILDYVWFMPFAARRLSQPRPASMRTRQRPMQAQQPATARKAA